MSYIKDELKKQQPAIDKKAEKDAKRAAKALADWKKSEEKRLATLDKCLTQVFNELSSNLDIAVKAIANNNGIITRKVGGSDSAWEFIKKGAAFGVKHVGELTFEDIEKNAAYQNYTQVMDTQGYDVEIISTNRAGNINGEKISVGILSTMGAAFLFTPLPPVQMVGGSMLFLAHTVGNSSTNSKSATISLHLKEKQPVPLLEHKPVENEMSDLLSQINAQQDGKKVAVKIKQPKQQPIIK